MMRHFNLLVLALSVLCLASSSSAQSPMKIKIDATQLSRKLLTAEIELPVPSAVVRQGGEMALWYPKWVPGSHGPGGPIGNLAGLVLEDANGDLLNGAKCLERAEQFISEQ